MHLTLEGSSGSPKSPMWLIGRDYGEQEQRANAPFVGRAGHLLDSVLGSAGILRGDCFIDNIVRRQPPRNEWLQHRSGDVAAGMAHLRGLIRHYKPKLVVALGNEAFRVVMDVDPDDAATLPTITEARGYLWDSPLGVRVLAAIHPAAVEREYVPWRPLLQWDFRKARAELEAGCPTLPQREVVIASDSEEFANVLKALNACSIAAFDLENDAALRLACLGVAVSPQLAFVVPAATDEQLNFIRVLCEHPVGKVLQNGMYDRYFLRRRCGIEMQNVVWDTMLAWHATQPELAGMREDSSKRKRMRRKTQKGLRFLASLYTREPFWKDYDFASEDERYRLCGIDCCVTLEITGRQR